MGTLYIIPKNLRAEGAGFPSLIAGDLGIREQFSSGFSELDVLFVLPGTLRALGQTFSGFVCIQCQSGDGKHMRSVIFF